MSKYVLVVGNLGYSSNKIDGQTIKTRNLVLLFKKKSDLIIIEFDTDSIQFNKFSIFRLIGKLLTYRQVFYLPAHRNLKLFFPIVYLLSTIRRGRLFYVVIGGWLPEFLKNKPIHRWMLGRIKRVYCETKSMKSKLENWYSFQNVKVMPNFRVHSFEASLSQPKIPLKVVFMSRITLEKGLDVIYRFLKFNQECKQPMKINFTFIGPIAEKDKLFFENLLGSFLNVNYLGVLDPEKVHLTLNKYDVLVLPTRYEGEGFPGAILDAYIAGIPVIVSKWKDIPCFVDHGSTGFVFDLKNEEEFYFALNFFYNNPQVLLEFKNNALNKSLTFSAEACWEDIANELL